MRPIEIVWEEGMGRLVERASPEAHDLARHPQALGVFPTWTFWSQRDVLRISLVGNVVAPIAAVLWLVSFGVFAWLGYLMPRAPGSIMSTIVIDVVSFAAAALAGGVTFGVLERELRQRLSPRDRR